MHQSAGEGERVRERAHTHRREKEKQHIHMRQRERESNRERERVHAGGGERKRKSACTRGRAALCPLVLYVFRPRWACPMQIGRGQECCLFSLKSSLPSSPHSGLPTFLDLPLFYFHGLFPSLSFRHRHFGLLFPILTT